MTRRERLERKIERREEWAAGRRAKAAPVAAESAKYRGDYAFNTQPGHIPARARLIKREERAYEDVKMAQHHDSKAAGLQAQLDRSIYTDDGDAVTQLEARIAEREKQRDAMKAANATWRKLGKPGAGPAGETEEALAAWSAQWVAVKEACGWTDAEFRSVLRGVSIQPYYKGQPFPPYALTNLGALIRTDAKRIEEVKRREARAVEVEKAGGFLISYSADRAYCSVTFAEKPAREVLEALRAAGFWWGKGSWSGKGEALPACVAALVATPAPVEG